MELPLWTERCTHPRGENIRHEIIMDEQADCQFCGAVNSSNNARLLPRRAAQTTEARQSRSQRGLSHEAYDPRLEGHLTPAAPAAPAAPIVQASQKPTEQLTRRSVAPSIGTALDAKNASLA